MLRNALFKAVDSVLGRRLPGPTEQDNRAIAQLRASLKELPAPDASGKSPSEREWIANVMRLRELATSHDPREFLRWDVIQKTMYVNQARYVRQELRYLKQRADWAARWRIALVESISGRPIPYLFYPASSGNLIHHAYHVAQFEEKTGRKVADLKLVVEAGGGYGSMCRLFHKAGFQGKYVIIDLPEFSALQSYYLRTLALPVRSRDEQGGTAKGGVWCLSDIEEFKPFLRDADDSRGSLFIGTWSISEMPIEARERILSIASAFSAYLFAYQDQFGEVDNVAFFQGWRRSVSNINWRDWRIPHLPGNSYLVGNRAVTSSGGGELGEEDSLQPA